MDLNEDLLTDLVYKLPHLWEKKNSQYKDKVAVENGWKSISHIMNMPIFDCQHLWGTIRNKYTRERRVLKNLPSGSGAYAGKWHLFDKLGFLDTVISTRKSKGNILKNQSGYQPEEWKECSVDVEGFLDEENSQESEEFSEGQSRECESLGEFSQSTVASTPSKSQVILTPSKSTVILTPSNSTNESPTRIATLRQEANKYKRKKHVQLDNLLKSCNDVGSTVNEALKKFMDEDIENKGDYHFCMSLAESIKGIRDKKKLLLKSKILQLVAEAADSESD